MLNTVYRLVEPRRFEAQFTNIDISQDDVLVRPTHLSICHADQRYYQGTRAKEVLDKKLPMSLIHEGIGVVEYDPKGKFEVGKHVVMIPNTPCEEDPYIGENYLRSSKFRGSGFDGFMQDYVAMQRDRLVLLPERINLNVAAFTEIVSVSYHAINRFIKFSHERRDRIGIWGDGNLAFITSLLLKKKLPDSEVLIFGVNDYKMRDFVFADGTYDIGEIPSDLIIDHAFECVGRAASGNAINQIIDYIRPQGSIVLMGVSENNVAINTRMVLEKGLTLLGNSRSSYGDFKNAIDFLENNVRACEYMDTIISEEIEIRDIKDMSTAFERDKNNNFKTVMKWNI